MAIAWSWSFTYSRAQIRCSSARESDNGRQHSELIKVNGTKLNSMHSMASQVGAALETAICRSLAQLTAPNLSSFPAVGQDARHDGGRQNIPTEKQTVDPFRQALIVDGGVRYQQTLVVRSYEVGPDRTATLETILNLLQETALNHVWMSGLLGDGFGATHGMTKNNLIWVVTRMRLEVDKYPLWGEVLEIDTWVGASGKNGMRRDWLIRSRNSGAIFARATSTWVMMNKETRRLSKMPEEVRGEISPWFIDRHAINEGITEKIIKLDDNAKYVLSDLKPKRSDLDMNHHVNNVKYVRWMLETLPDQFLQNHELSSIVLEYRKECGSSDIVQSICEPDKDLVAIEANVSILKESSLRPEIINGHHNTPRTIEKWPTGYTHLLQLKGDQRYEEIVRGRTIWKKKSYRASYA